MTTQRKHIITAYTAMVQNSCVCLNEAATREQGWRKECIHIKRCLVAETHTRAK